MGVQLGLLHLFSGYEKYVTFDTFIVLAVLILTNALFAK